MSRTLAAYETRRSPSLARSELSGRFRDATAWRYSGTAFGALGIASLVIQSTMRPDSWGAVGVVCSLGLIIACHGIASALRDGAKRAISDHFIVLVAAFTLYFLLGPLLLVLGPEEQAAAVSSWYPTTPSSALAATSINLVGISLLLWSAGFLPGEFFERLVPSLDSALERIPARTAFWVFLILGTYCTYKVVSFDLAGNGELLMGLIRTLSQVVLIAVLIGAMYEGPGAWVLRFTAVLVAAFMSFVGLLLFNKSAILYPWLIFLFGTYLRRPSAKWVFLAIGVVALALGVLTRPMGEARVILNSGLNANFETRRAILKDVFDVSSNSAPSSIAQTWARICYTPAQVAAIDLYDTGHGGDDVELLGWVLLPRLLFPDKPVITRSAVDFNEKITGFDTSSTGMGLFVNGYYNLGWFGVVAVSVLAGLMLAVFSAMSRSIVRTRSMLLLPICMLGAYTSFRIDGHFVADFWGMFAMVMVPLILFSLTLRNRNIGKASG